MFNNRYKPLNSQSLNSQSLNRQWIKFKISQNYQNWFNYKRNSEEVIYCDTFKKNAFKKRIFSKRSSSKTHCFKIIDINKIQINKIQNVLRYMFEYLLLNLIVRCFCVSFLKIYFKDNFLYELLKTFNMDQEMIF